MKNLIKKIQQIRIAVILFFICVFYITVNDKAEPYIYVALILAVMDSFFYRKADCSVNSDPEMEKRLANLDDKLSNLKLQQVLSNNKE